MNKVVYVSTDGFNDNDKQYGNSYYGIIIKTEENEYRFGVDAGASCCEDFGCDYSDNIYELLGKNIKAIYDVPMQYKHPDVLEGFRKEILAKDGSVYFIECYNNHNGYYGHSFIGEDIQFNQKR